MGRYNFFKLHANIHVAVYRSAVLIPDSKTDVPGRQNREMSTESGC